MKRLKDKISVITGGASGIGHASVLRFLSEGAKVVLADLNEEAGLDRVKEITDRGDGERIRFFHCDVSDELQVMQMFRFTLGEFGRIDCIFNNAGVGGAHGRLIDTRVEDWDRTQVYLLRSAFLCIKHAAIAMIGHKTEGSIVNNAALAALFGDSAGAAYSAAKAGVINLTKTAAVQLAKHKIRVNSISPGTILSPLMLDGGDVEAFREAALSCQAWPEVGTPEHVAAVAAFLASNEARFVTGENIVVDGGFAAGGPGLYRSEHELSKVITKRSDQAGVKHFDFGNTGLKEGNEGKEGGGDTP